jgi:hypothetical protein
MKKVRQLVVLAVGAAVLLSVAWVGVQPASLAAVAAGGEACTVPKYQPPAAASADRLGHYPYQDWLANPAAQEAVAAVNSRLSAQFGPPGADGESDPLRAGLIGVVPDYYNQEFVVVADPSLVDGGNLEQELQAAADDSGTDANQDSPLKVRVAASCNSSSDLLQAQDAIGKRDWSPQAPEASYAFELDAATSTFSFTFDEKDREVADALKTKLQDLVTITFGPVSYASGGRHSDYAPHWGGAEIRHPATGGVCTSGFTATMPVPGGPNGSVTAAHCYENGDDLYANGFFGEARGESNFPEYDMMRIHGEDMTTYARKIHVDPCCPTVRDVVDNGNPAGVGSFVCASGEATEAVCGLEVVNMDAHLCVLPTCTEHLFRAHKDANIIAGGDSGGPVYNRFGDTDAAIRGMISGMSGSENLFASKVSAMKDHLNITCIQPC